MELAIKTREDIRQGKKRDGWIIDVLVIEAEDNNQELSK